MRLQLLGNLRREPLDWSGGANGASPKAATSMCLARYPYGGYTLARNLER